MDSPKQDASSDFRMQLTTDNILVIDHGNMLKLLAIAFPEQSKS